MFDNPHSEYTMEGLRASWGQMIQAINRALNETKNQMLIRDSKNLSEEQISEYRKSFNYFDKVKGSHNHRFMINSELFIMHTVKHKAS